MYLFFNRLVKAVALFTLLLGISGVLQASGPVDVFDFSSEKQKFRYKNLIEEFRCPKCLNINIAGSDAPIAQDLRRTVHRLLVEEGMSDDEIRGYLQERYGDFVLYDPPLTKKTWLIWFMPVLFLISGFLLIYSLQKRSVSQSIIELSQSDRQKLRSIVDDR